MTKKNIMNIIYKVLIYAALIIAIIGLFLPGVNKLPIFIGGITNYDSLELQPSSSSDNALRVRNSGGTDRFVVSGSGVVTISGAAILSGTVDITGELQAARIVNGGSILSIGSVATSGPSAAQICNNAGATLTMTATSGAFTFPESAALYSDCLESDGKSVFWKVSNLGTVTTSAQFTAASASTTLVGDAGIEVHVSDLLTGGESAILRFYRESGTKLIIFVSKFINSD